MDDAPEPTTLREHLQVLNTYTFSNPNPEDRRFEQVASMLLVAPADVSPEALRWFVEQARRDRADVSGLVQGLANTLLRRV